MPHFNRGVALLILGELDAAIVELNRTEELGFRSPELFYNRAVALRTVGRTADAVADFDQAVKLNPQWAQAYAERGTAYLTLCKPEKSVEDFRTAVSLAPERTDSHYFLAISLEYAGRTADAVSAYESYAAMSIPPEEISYVKDALEQTEKLKVRGNQPATHLHCPSSLK